MTKTEMTQMTNMTKKAKNAEHDKITEKTANRRKMSNHRQTWQNMTKDTLKWTK